MIRTFNFRLLLFFFIMPALFSCERERQVQFPVGIGIEGKLFAAGRAAREGTLDFSKTKKLEYRFDDSFTVTPNSSLVIEYDFNILPSQAVRENISLVLNTGMASWELPMDINGIQYAIPIDDSFGGNFSVILESSGRIERNEAPVFQIRSIRFTERRFGFSVNTGEYSLYSPFVHRRDSGCVIDIPDVFLPDGYFFEIEAAFSSGQASLEFAGRKIETLPGAGGFYIPPDLAHSAGQVILSAEGIGLFFVNVRQSLPAFPSPIKADPAFVLARSKEDWRNSGYEVFRWDRFPSLLIFDYANFAVQNRMLTRLAFFVEKAGYRGRILTDAQLAGLRGWNAHDYKADDLARFFGIARETNFPLLGEERELERILLDEGIIREESGGIVAGSGGILSISKESPDYLRNRFMAHEGFHGLFFIDEDFRNFTRNRWERLSAPAKRFITSYFDYMQYDTDDEYLLVNEFMAYVLQQSVSQARDYFGRQIPLLLESTWRASALPPKDSASGTWPTLATAFAAEAEALSAYVNQRWGLAAGRVWSIRVN
jgi:hypothetical protein